MPDASPPATASSRSLIRDILQKSSLYLFSIVFYRLISLLLFPIISRRLTPADYGVLEVLDQVTSVSGLLLGASFSSSLGYFLHRETATEARARVVGTIVAGSAMIGSFVALLGIFAAPFLSTTILRSADYTPYLYLMFLGVPLTFLVEAFLGWLRVDNLAANFTRLSMLRAILTLVGISVLLGLLHFRIWGMLISNTVAAGITAAVGLVLCVRRYRLRFDTSLFRQMLRFSIPLNLTGVALFTLHFGDRFLLPRYRPMAELGIYALAYKFGMLISLVQSSFDSYWSSQIYSLIKREDARSVFARIFTYMATVLLFAALAILLGGRIAIHVLAAPSYYGAITLFPLILCAYCIRACGDFFRAFFYALGKPGYDALCNWAAAILTLAGYVLLIPWAGTRGAVLATALGFTFVAVACPIWVYRLWPYHMEVLRLTKVSGVTALLAAMALLYPQPTLWLEIGQAAILLSAFPLLLFLLRFPQPGELDALRALRKRYLPSLLNF